MAALSGSGGHVFHNNCSIHSIDFGSEQTVDNEDLLAEASHELKTPLSSIRNSLALLKLGAAGPITKDAMDVLDVVDRSTTRLMDLVEEILFARRALVLEPLSVDSVISSAIEMVSGEIFSKCIDVQFVHSDLTILADEKKMVQVLVNLLSNAIKFSPANGVIKIQASSQNIRSVKISVADQGVGVPQCDLERIFLKHEQGKLFQDQGAGLGLSIAKRIVEQHGGQIGVYNATGGGATFWVRLKQVANSVEIKNNSLSLSDDKVA